MPGTPLIEGGAAPGFFGKIPSHGDFVTKRLPSAFTEPWDAWLQRGLVASREQLSDRWLELYLHGPIWRFLLPAGILGPSDWLGVLMPSIDKGGRHFPFTIAAPIASPQGPFRLLASTERWFDAIEDLALSALEDHFDAEALDLQLRSAHPPSDAGASPADDHSAQGCCVVGEPPDPPVSLLLDLADRMAGQRFRRSSVWRTSGSKYVKPMLLVCPTLPAPETFATLLDGNGSRWTEMDPSS